ncbi:MAG: hypothetical protein HY515_04130 [Candidatus Aenigmarchaeota archaeon]|nr:hypothetical protein [Candidatus Aenigmarchaeota archaeon]
MRKGLSPLIASVLLVAFTMAVAAIIVTWITGFTQQQTSNIGTRGERQVLCGYSVLSVDRDDVSATGTNFNVTVTYSGGTETLNITGFTLRDANGVTYTNITPLGSSATGLNWAVGESRKFINYNLTNNAVIPGGVALAEFKVTGLCQSQYVVTGTVKF